MKNLARQLGVVSRNAMKEYLLKFYGTSYHSKTMMSVRRWESMISSGKKNPTYLSVAGNLVGIAQKYKLSEKLQDEANEILEAIKKSDCASLRTKINFLETYNRTEEEREASRHYLSGFTSEG